MGDFVRHEGCPQCGSKDNVAVYADGSKFCFSDCGFFEGSEEIKSKRQRRKMKETVKETPEKMKEIIDEDDVLEIQQKTFLKGNGYRGIKDCTLKYFKVRTEYDKDGDVQAVYYPCTFEEKDGTIIFSGYKIRKHPKDFKSIGRTGQHCQMFGESKFQNGGRTCVLVGGEHDALAAYQMLREYQLKRHGDKFDPVAVVSSTVGETSSAKQIASRYKFFDRFQKIVVAYDNDEAGKKATEKVMNVLPKGKVFVMKMRHKDPNQYIDKGDEDKFINDYYEAKKYVPTGVVGSNEISERMREELKVLKIPLPPFMHRLQDMMAGGIPLGRIVNLASASGTGKSTFVDELIYYWIFNSPHLCGIVTLESDVGQYGIKLLSRHLSNKIELLNTEEAFELIDSEENLLKEKELFSNSEGSPRFYLVDDRDGTVQDIKEAIENLIISCSCKVIILDPIQDIIAALPNEEQEMFVTWQKGMIKSHKCTFINVCHMRKSKGGDKAGSQGADSSEEDIMGSSSIYKSGACNLIFRRNKEAEDDIEKNTTIMKSTKCRWTGKTGIGGRYYYDIKTHTLHDFDDYFGSSLDDPEDF